LLSLANSDRSFTFEFLDFVNFDESISCGSFDLGKLLFEEFLSKFGVIAAFPMPVSGVPA
jgi:hypothetical protein